MVGGVGVDAVRPGPLKFLPAVSAGHQADAERPGPPRGDRSHTLSADDDRVPGIHPQQGGGGQEQVRIGFGVADQVRVTIGVSSGRPSSPRAGRAVTVCPLVAMAQWTPAR